MHVIETKYGTQKKSHESLVFESKVLKDLAYKNKILFGNIDTNKLKRIQDVYGLMGLMKDDIDFKNFLFDSNQIYLTKEEQEFIKNTNLTVSVSKDFRPFSFQNKDSSPSGISSEYWDILVKELGLHVKYQFEDTFTKQLKAIENKTADIICSTGATPEREKYSIFTQEYTSFPISIATKNNVDFIEDFSKVIDKKIAVGKNFTAHKLLQKLYPKINFVYVDNISEGLKLVDKGEVFGFVDMKPTLLYNIQRLRYDDIKIAGNTGAIFKVSIMIRDDYPLLQSILNKAINNTNKDDIHAIIKSYEKIEFEESYEYKFLYPFILIAIVIFVAFVLRQYFLNKANKRLQILVKEQTKDLRELNETLETRIQKAIEENKNKDAILYQQAKMASMGEMIGNIAHQWRQPLSVISTTVTGMSFKMEYGAKIESEELLESFERVNDTVQFLSKTIDDFQDYLKPQKIDELFNIKDVITQNLEMFGKTFANNDIKIVLDIHDVFVKNSKNELLQVTINILNNAKDALKEFVAENKLLFISIYKEGDFGIISIKDNAGGVPDEVLPKIFDAYFTTKHKSQGTGLGLYMSYQIVTNRFKGNIKVINEEYEYEGKEYKGANFKITLPIESNKENHNG
jgi:signal transduction histidine kinase